MASEKFTQKIINRPKEVEYAIKLLLTSIVFGAVVGYLGFSSSADNQYTVIYSNFVILGLLFNGYMTYKISQNRDWARKLYILSTLLSTVFYIPELATSFYSTPINSFLQLVNILIQLLVVYFLLQKSAKEWFTLVKSKAID